MTPSDASSEVAQAHSSGAPEDIEAPPSYYPPSVQVQEAQYRLDQADHDVDGEPGWDVPELVENSFLRMLCTVS